MNWNNPVSFRLRKDKPLEKELIIFFEQHGLKNGIKYLFKHYKDTLGNDIDTTQIAKEVIKEIKRQGIGVVSENTTKPTQSTDEGFIIDEEADDMISTFLD